MVGLKQRASVVVARWALVLDKHTVTYGYGPAIFRDGGVCGWGWVCGRCLDGRWDLPTPPEAQTSAEEHADTHPGVRAVYEKG